MLPSFYHPPSCPLQAYDGTVARLRQSLINMNRLDAVNIIDSVLAQGNAKEQATKAGEGSSKSKTPQGM